MDGLRRLRRKLGDERHLPRGHTEQQTTTFNRDNDQLPPFTERHRGLDGNRRRPRGETTQHAGLELPQHPAQQCQDGGNRDQLVHDVRPPDEGGRMSVMRTATLWSSMTTSPRASGTPFATTCR